MKEVILTIIGVIAFCAALFTGLDYITDLNNPKSDYCGTVTETYVVSGKSGENSVRIEHRLVFYCPALRRKINLSVTENCYSNSTVGSRVCFTIRKSQTE